MRRLVLVLVFVALVTAANSQLTIRPQAGLENPKTKISYNNLGYFSPITQVQPQFSLRADYKFKSRFGPFAGVSTSHSLISYNFSDPENGMTAYKASLANTQLQLQGGLQYSTKPIYFKKQTPTNKTSKAKSAEKSTNSYSSYSSGCHRYSSGCSRYSSSCGAKKSSTAEKTKSPNKGWSVSLQPSAGFGYIPSDKPGLETITSGSQTEYAYHAGNMKTALLTGMGFEFAKNKTRLFSVSVNYFKGLADNETTFTSQTAGKTITTTLNSKTSGWNASIGIPIGFTKKTTTKHKAEQKVKSDCQQYRIQYKYRCGKTI
jgi:hypothetical protein